MKTITPEQHDNALNKAYNEAGQNAYFGNGFNAGIEFAQKLQETQEQKVQEALQEIYNFADHLGNNTAMQIISEVVKINEALEIEILM